MGIKYQNLWSFGQFLLAELSTKERDFRRASNLAAPGGQQTSQVLPEDRPAGAAESISAAVDRGNVVSSQEGAAGEDPALSTTVMRSGDRRQVQRWRPVQNAFDEERPLQRPVRSRPLGHLADFQL